MSWISPTGHVASAWNNEERAYDDDTLTLADIQIPFFVTCDYLQLTHAVLDSDKLRIWVDCSSWASVNPIELDVHRNGAWEVLFNDTGNNWPTKNNWHTFNYVAEGNVDALRLRGTGMNFMAHPWLRCIEADFWELAASSHKPCSSLVMGI